MYNSSISDLQFIGQISGSTTFVTAAQSGEDFIYLFYIFFRIYRLLFND